MRAITSQVKPALRHVAKRGAYFLKAEVVNETLRRADVLEAVIEIRRAYRGKGLDDAILRSVDIDVSRALRARDNHGMRMYECFVDGTGGRRWRRLTYMSAADLTKVLRDLTTLRDQLSDKIAAYEIVVEELGSSPTAVMVADVYDRAWLRILSAGVRVERLAS